MRKKNRYFGFLFLASLLAFAYLLTLPKNTLAANPATINFQGKVANSDGTNVNSGTNNYTVVFRLYQNVNNSTYDPNALGCSSDTNCWWEETDTVSVTNGVFQVSLGATCAFTGACNSGHSGISFNSQNALSLTMKFNGDSNGFMRPLMSFQSVPYAFNADNLGGIAAGGFVQLAQGVQTDSSTSNSSIFINKTGGTANILQLQKTGKNVMVVDNSGNLLLGEAGTGGINGSLVFNTTNASNTTISIVAASTGTSYSLTLPTSGPTTSQCLQTDSVTASQLKFAACGGGSSATLQDVYNNSSSPATITTSSSSKTVAIKAGSGDDSTSLFQVQSSAGGGTDIFTVDSVNSQIAVRGTNSLSTLGSEKVTNGSFTSNASGWTLGTGWAYNSNNVTKTPGTASILEQNVSAVAGETYEIVFSIISRTAGTITPSIGGSSWGPINLTNTGEDLLIQASTTGNLQFSADSSFDGTIDDVSVKKVTLTNPVIVVKNSDATAGLDIRAGGSNDFNTGIGLNALQFNNGVRNTAVGAYSLQDNTSGTYNTALGAFSLQSNTSGFNNVAVGSTALTNNTVGSYNVGIGRDALLQNTAGYSNTAIGYRSLTANTSGNNNIALGHDSLLTNTTGSFNTSLGNFSLSNNLDGTNNTALGFGSLGGNTSGGNNVAIGTSTLVFNTTGLSNIAIGYNSLNSNTTGSSNTAIGYYAGYYDPQTSSFATLNNLQKATMIGYGAQAQADNVLVLGGAGTNAVNVGIGTTAPSNLFSVSPDIYDTGTASVTSGTTAVTESGATWSSNYAGMEIIFADGKKYTIASATSTTITLASNATATESGSAYRIHNPAFYVTATGSAGIRSSTNSTTAFQVQDSTGTNVLNVDTTDGFVGIGTGTSAPQVKLQVAGGHILLDNNRYYEGLTSTGGVRNLFGINTSDVTVIGNAGNGLLFKNGAQTADLVTISNSGDAAFNGTANSTTAFQINNSSNLNILNVDTQSTSNTNNIIPNPSIESTISGNWAKKGGSETLFAQDSTQQFSGTKSLKVTTTAAIGDGAKVTPSGGFTSSATYSVSFYAKLDSASNSFATLAAGYNDGSDTDCTLNTSTVNSNGWTKYVCSFTKNASTTGYFYVRQTDNVVHTFYIDAVMVQAEANAVGNYHESQISLNGTIVTPTILQNAINSTNAFQVQNSDGGSVFNIDTTDTNLLTNPGFELNDIGWAKKGSTVTMIRDTSQAKTGLASLKVITSGAANDGVSHSYTFLNTAYTLSFSIKNTGANTFATLQAGWNTGSDNTCTLSPTPTTTNLPATDTAWNRFSCTFTPSAGAGNIFIRQSDANAHTFYLDSVQLELGSTQTPYGFGQISLNGSITSPVTIKNQSDSMTEFMIQNAASSTLFQVDANNNIVYVGNPTADATGVILVLDTKNNAGDPNGVNGGMYYNSNTGSFRCYQNGIWENCLGGLATASTSSSTAASCTTLCSPIATATSAWPANYCVAGRTTHIYISGVWGSNNSAPTLNLGVYLGTSTTKTSDTLVGVTSDTNTMTASVTARGWDMDIYIICVSATTVLIHGSATFSTSATTGANIVTKLYESAVTGTVTTSAANIYVFPTWGTSNASNTITANQTIVQEM